MECDTDSLAEMFKSSGVVPDDNCSFMGTLVEAVCGDGKRGRDSPHLPKAVPQPFSQSDIYEPETQNFSVVSPRQSAGDNDISVNADTLVVDADLASSTRTKDGTNPLASSERMTAADPSHSVTKAIHVRSFAKDDGKCQNGRGDGERNLSGTHVTRISRVS